MCFDRLVTLLALLVVLLPHIICSLLLVALQLSQFIDIISGAATGLSTPKTCCAIKFKPTQQPGIIKMPCGLLLAEKVVCESGKS